MLYFFKGFKGFTDFIKAAREVDIFPTYPHEKTLLERRGSKASPADDAQKIETPPQPHRVLEPS